MEKSELIVSGDKLIQLAALLEQAVKLMREIEWSERGEFKPVFSLLKRPKHVPKDQEWFWSDEWQTGERQVNEDLRAGRYKIFDTVEKLFADLDAGV